MIYSYTKSINGFAAYLDEDQAKEISKSPNVICVFPNTLRKLHTTKSWDFLGLEDNNGVVALGSIWKKARYGEDVIIASIDTGVWPESKSFNDKGMGPVPSRWKGYCEQVDNPKDMVKCNSKLCSTGSLDPNKVKGKIVVCVRGDSSRMKKAEEVSRAGGVGMIVANTNDYGEDLIADPYMIPGVHIGYTAASTIYSYLNSTRSPVGHIGAPKAHYGLKPAPFVAEFSSRGPNYVTPQILKPDILAPGVDILAAYSQAVPPSQDPFDTRRVAFNILSGTSMACPHVSGVVGLLKALHPDWSPAALRSAIMTTARTRDNTRKAIKDSFMKKSNPFGYGAGHIQPNHAVDPGLVYDLNVNDYLNFLCTIGYNSSKMVGFAKDFVCPPQHIDIQDLNYPSITVYNLSTSTTVSRTLKNVGTPGTYRVRFKAPPGVSVLVNPVTLKFNRLGEEKTYKVTFSKKAKLFKDYVFGQLIWYDGKHNVRSPLVVNAG